MTAMLRGYPVEVGDELYYVDVNHRPGTDLPKVVVTKMGRTRIHYSGTRGDLHGGSCRMDDGRVSDWAHCRTIAEHVERGERSALLASVRSAFDNYGPAPQVSTEKLRRIVAILDEQ